MARPPVQLPPRGPWGPPAPQLFQPFVLPKTFYPQELGDVGHRGPARRVPLESPPGPARLPLTHTGLQRAPCGCLFDPRVFGIQWTTTHLPPPATATLGQGAASLPGAALWGPGGCGAPLAWTAPGTPQGQPQYLAPYKNQRSGVAPAPLELPVSIPGYQHIEGQLAQINIPSTATPVGAPLGSDVSPSPCAATHNQATGDTAGDLAVSEEMLLEEALRLFDCSLDGVGVSQDGPSSGPMPGDPAGTSGEGRGMAPAPPAMPTPIPGHKDIEGPLAKINTCGMATHVGAPPGSDVPPSPCADPHNQALGEPVGELAASEKVPLQEALVLFGCSPDGVGVNQDAPSRSSMPGDTGGTGAATPNRDFSSLSLPEELLTPDYCIPELSNIMLSLEIFNIIRMEPQEL
ncbi:proline-rich protein 22-like [Buteo buteo]|uniref:proline-rich protein 22-like n=1 Tax=Buteo buteo TaxID=30397 RepID=UPI003EBC6303